MSSKSYEIIFYSKQTFLLNIFCILLYRQQFCELWNYYICRKLHTSTKLRHLDYKSTQEENPSKLQITNRILYIISFDY